MNNRVKKLIKEKKTIIGSWLALAHPSIAEIMAKAGFDFIVIDMEHSAIGIADAQLMIQIIELCGCTPLVRVSSNDEVLIKRVMDAGAHGILVPMVNSRADAEKAVASVRYPLKGRRGVGLARAQGYGKDFEEYIKTAAEETLVVAQIEHKDAVENIDAIVSVDGIDAVIIGPYDMSGSYGIPGKFDDKVMVDAQAKVLAAAKNAGKAAGTHIVYPDTEKCQARIKEGYSFIAYGVDMIFLGEQCRKDIARIKK